jgi:tripartite-type tricarboxylate transporter receptor subunit TctC
MFSNLPQTIEYIRAGKLRPLAVTTSARLDILPHVPTVGDTVPGYETSGWAGIGAPRNTPAEIVARLNREVNEALADLGIRNVWLIWASARCPDRPPTLYSSSRTKPASGRR